MKTTSKRMLVGLVFAIVAIATTASGGSARVGAPQKKKLPMKTIGIMGPVDAAEVIKLGTDATATAAKALGWKVINLDPGGDLAKTAADMNSLVNSHVDAIVLTIIEPATVQAGLRAAAKAHIPVINTMSQTHASPLEADCSAQIRSASWQSGLVSAFQAKSTLARSNCARTSPGVIATMRSQTAANSGHRKRD